LKNSWTSSEHGTYHNMMAKPVGGHEDLRMFIGVGFKLLHDAVRVDHERLHRRSVYHATPASQGEPD
jgi:hypothetical protein